MPTYFEGKKRILVFFAAIALGFLAHALFFSMTGSCSIEPAFSPGSEQKIMNLVRASHEKIDIEMYQFSYSPLMEELANAVSRGVAVRIILDNTVDSNFATAKVLAARGIQVRFTPKKFTRVHAKYAIFDKAALLVGSTNWSFHAMFLNREASILLKDESALSSFESVFESDWALASPYLA